MEFWDEFNGRTCIILCSLSLSAFKALISFWKKDPNIHLCNFKTVSVRIQNYFVFFSTKYQPIHLHFIFMYQYYLTLLSFDTCITAQCNMKFQCYISFQLIFTPSKDLFWGWCVVGGEEGLGSISIFPQWLLLQHCSVYHYLHFVHGFPKLL